MVEQVDAVEPIRPRQPPVVGRERERALLHGQLEGALAGQGSLILVGGEAGIGKTTLVADLARQAEEAGCLVLWGHSYDLSVTPPYGPWVELATSYRPTDGLPPFPDFLHSGEALAAVGSREALFARTWDFFATVAGKKPVVLILEDVHWADQESLDLLRFVARQVARHRVLVLATYRSDELTRRHPLYQLIPLLVREANAERLDVLPLDAEAQHALIGERYGLPEADTVRLEAYLRDHAEGNPLYASELLRTLEDDGVLVVGKGRWWLGDLARVRVPPLLMQVIEGRLRRLTEEARRLLEIGAVIGPTIPVDVWQRVGGAGDEALAAAIEQGLEAHLLSETPGGAVCFSHALVREALYAGIVLVRRRGWHRAVAETLVETRSPDPDAVAHHFEQAGDQRAVEWLLKAGERAQRTYAWTTAATRYEAVLARLAEQGAPATERAALLFRIAYLNRFVDARRALTLMDEAQALAVEAGDASLAALCRFRAGLFQCYLGDVRRGIVAIGQGVAEWRAASDADQARVSSLTGRPVSPPEGTLTIWLAYSGRLDEAIALGERRILTTPPPAMRAGQGGSSYADGYHGLAVAHALRGQPQAARRAFDQARTVFQAIEHHTLLAKVCEAELVLRQLPYFPEQRQERARLAAEAETAARRASGAVPTKLPPQYVALALTVLEGRWQEAREVATAAHGQLLWSDRLSGAPRLAFLACEQGESDLAWRIIADVLPDGPATEPGNPFLWTALLLQLLAAQLALDATDLPVARAWLEAHDRWLEWSGAVLWQAEGALGWAAYHHADGNRSLARRRAEEALVHASEPRQPLALIAVHRFLGKLDTKDRCFADARAHLEQSLALADACAAPFERALTLEQLAVLRAAQGKPKDGRVLLAEVRSICEPLGARPTLARVAALESQLAPAPKPTYPAGLSAREVEVLRLVAEGLSDAEVADRLYLSPRTVSQHLRSVYNKLGVSSRTAATRFAVDHGLT